MGRSFPATILLAELAAAAYRRPAACYAMGMAEAVDASTDKAHAMKMTGIVVLLAAGFALIPRATAGCGMRDEEAPDFTANVLANALAADQTTLTLSALRGQPVVLDFWATWCGPCQASAPIVNAVSQRYRDRGLVVVGVNVDDDTFPVERFVRKKGLTFPIVYDEGKSISRDYGASTLPTLIVVSKEGKIVAVRHGVTSESDLDGLVRKVL
jgi:cytochrome c biogenesis protein CcmG, thiol:disulfide interchange protein DsbE